MNRGGDDMIWLESKSGIFFHQIPLVDLEQFHRKDHCLPNGCCLEFPGST